MNSSNSRSKLIAAVMLSMLLLLPATGLLMAQTPEVGGQVSLGQTEAAITVVLNNLPQATAGTIAAPSRFASLRPYGGVSEAEYQARKLKAKALTMAATLTGVTENALPPALAPGSNGVYTPGTGRNFEGINETCSSLTPSDMGIAVSQFFGLQIVNSCITVFNLSTGAPYAGYPKSLAAFYGLPAGSFIFDPRVLFDWVLRKFVVVALRADFANSRGFLEVAASKNDDPRGLWNIYHIQGGGTGTCPDFPTLGQNYYSDSGNGAVAVGFNVFPCNANGFFGGLADNQIYFLSKSAMYAGAGFSFNIFSGPTANNTLVDTIQPANVQSRSDKPRAIFGVSSYNINFGGGQCSTGCNSLVVWAFSNVLTRTGSPGLKWSAVQIATPSNYSFPPNASQPNSPSGASGRNTIDTNDTRISGQVYYTAGSLWATVNTNNGGNGSAVLAWQIKPVLNDNDNALCTTANGFVNWCPAITGATIEQELGYDIGGGTGLNAYYGTIVPDPERNITMVFAFSGDSYYPSVAYVSRRVTQAAAGWHDSGVFLRSGAAYYDQGRWGDYTGVANDLLDPVTASGSTVPGMWFSGQDSRSDGSWGTAIGRNGFVQSNQP